MGGIRERGKGEARGREGGGREERRSHERKLVHRGKKAEAGPGVEHAGPRNDEGNVWAFGYARA